jgi:acyl carrier protein
MDDSQIAVDDTLVPGIIKHAVRMVAPDAPETVTDADRLIGDLGFHSLALVELAFVLEELFQLDPITPEQAMSIEQVSDIGDLITAALATGLTRLPTPELIMDVSSQYGVSWAAEG